MAGIKIKRNDRVEVIAGKDKGKQGRVLRVIGEKNRLLVEGVMMMKKHVKPNPQRNIKGGIAEQEATIHISNVMLLDAEGNKTRVGMRLEGENKVRYSKVSGSMRLLKRRSRAKSEMQDSSPSLRSGSE